MPKDTFFNLPEEKRERIIHEAVLEFGQYTYDAASINRIVEASGISKGSFYQYFEDKKDLYKQLLQVTVNKKLEYMSPVLMNPEGVDFFTLTRELYLSGLSFAKENPELVDMGNKLMADRTHPIYNELLKDSLDQSATYFKVLIEKAQEKGEVRQGIDPELSAYMLTSLNIMTVDYYRNKGNESWDDDLMPYVDQLLDFLKNGIGNKEDTK